jgi:hypothetical protein
MSGYAIARLDEIDEITDGRQPWRPVRHHFGIASFGVNTWTAPAAGDRIINEHDEEDDGQEELYFVHTGRATFELAGERVDAPAGSWVFVRAGVKRTAFAEEAGTTLIALGGSPGKAYTPGGWEVWAPLRPLYEAGDYAAVVEQGRQIIEAHPEYPEPLYNLACCEALAGHTDDAIRHLRLAVDRYEPLREFAKEDSDLGRHPRRAGVQGAGRGLVAEIRSGPEAARHSASQPRTSPSVSDGSGSGSRIIRTELAMPTRAAASVTSSATCRARCRASSLMLRTLVLDRLRLAGQLRLELRVAHHLRVVLEHVRDALLVGGGSTLLDSPCS